MQSNIFSLSIFIINVEKILVCLHLSIALTEIKLNVKRKVYIMKKGQVGYRQDFEDQILGQIAGISMAPRG